MSFNHKQIFLFPLLFLCAWVPSSGDVTKLSTAERVILEAYASALAILPNGAQSSIQKKLGLWVRDNKGGSVWGNIEVSGSFPYQSVNSTILNSSSYVYDCSFKIGSFDYFPYQSNYTQRTCVRSGFVVDFYGGYWPSYLPNIASWPRNYDSWKMVSYSGAQSPSSVLAHCAVGRGYSSAGVRDGVSGNYYTDVLYYLPASNCQMTGYSETPRILLDIPYTANLNDTASILSILKSADSISLDIPIISTYTQGSFTFTKSTSIASAINYIENGVLVDGPIGQTSSIYPDTLFSGVSSNTFSPSGSSVSVNVSVNVSTIEIVNLLDEQNNYFVRGSTPDIESFDYDSLANPIINKSTGLISGYLTNLSSSAYMSVLQKFNVEESSAPVFPCVNFSFPYLGINEQICIEQFPGFSLVMQLFHAFFQIACFMYSCRILYKGDS